MPQSFRWPLIALIGVLGTVYWIVTPGDQILVAMVSGACVGATIGRLLFSR